MAPPKKAKMGRPPKKASEQRRHVLSVRFRDVTWQRLLKAIDHSRRSLSQEVEFRVEQALLEHGYATPEESMAMYRSELQITRKLSKLIRDRDPSVQSFIVDLLGKKK